jgi:hypothetical protein
MLTVTKVDNNRVDLHLRGAVSAEGMSEGLDALFEAADGLHHGRMLYTIDDFHWPDAGALAVEFGRLPQLLGLIGKFDRCAVIAGEQWIRTVAAIEGALMPGLTIKTFSPAQRDDAEAWLEFNEPS